jgi:recombinational DNA repair ATPase RecF
MYIFSKRKEAVESLSKCTAEFYSLISGGKESVSIEYVSELYDDMPLSLFDKSREKDKALKYTTSGVHRDDLNFLMDGHPIRKCASQGQQKSFLISLKNGAIQDNESDVWCYSYASFGRCFRQVGPLEGVSIDKYGSEGEFRSGFHHRYRPFKG